MMSMYDEWKLLFEEVDYCYECEEEIKNLSGGLSLKGELLCEECLCKHQGVCIEELFTPYG